MNLHFKTLGEGQPVILIHGLFGASDNLGMVARPLAKHFQTISVDLRNHGRSPHSSIMDYPSMAGDIEQLMTKLGIDSAYMLGHSMGGKVAMQLALNKPERVSKLVVADIAPVRYAPHHSNVMEGLKRLAGESISSRTDADRLLALHIEEPEVRQFLLTNLVRKEDKSFGLRLNIDALAANQQQISIALEGSPFNKPALFIRGANSDYIKPSDAAVIDQLFTCNRVVTIDNAGHWLHAEQTDAFNRVIMDFLR